MFKFTSDSQRLRKINLDSRYRNLQQNPNPYDVIFPLGEDINNITILRTIDVQVPATDYNITEYDNKFTVRDNGVDYNVVIPPGDYDSVRLVTVLNQLFADDVTGAGATNTYSVSINADGMLVVEGAGGTLPFRLLYATGANSDVIMNTNGDTWKVTQFNGSARIIMGFNIADYVSAVDPVTLVHTITSPNKVNLDGQTYVLLALNPVGNESDSMNNVETANGNVKPVYMKVPLNTPNNAVGYWYNFVQEFQKIHPAITRIRRIQARLLRFDGNPYNTRGIDWSMTLELGTLQ